MPLRNRLLCAMATGLPPLLACVLHLPAQAQAQAPTLGGIFMCTDARGRTITADRPIPDCIDRQQRELAPSGAVRRTLDPTFTSHEQAERDERARQAALKAARITEERRRDRALVARYPHPASHDRARADAISQIDAMIELTRRHIAELVAARRPLDEELEFYRNDLGRAPTALRRKFDDNAQSMAIQADFLAAREEEKKRIGARFDEERERLQRLWSPGTAPAAARQ